MNDVEAIENDLDPVKLGIGLRLARTNAGLTQAELGELIGTTQVRISSLERGEVTVTAEAIQPLCEALDVTPETLLTMADAAVKFVGGDPPTGEEPAPPRKRVRPAAGSGKRLVRREKFPATPPAPERPPLPPAPSARVIVEPAPRPFVFDGFRPGSEEYRLLCKLVDGTVGVDEAARRFREIVAEKVTGG